MQDYTKQELLRLVHQLRETDPTTQAYHVLLHSIECLDSLGPTVDAILELVSPVNGDCNEDCASCPSCEEAEAGADIVDFPVPPPEVHPAEEPKPKKKKADPPAEEPTLSAAEVRSKLAAARRAGVNVAALIKEFGADNFTALPATKYGELLQRIADTSAGQD